MPSQKSRFRGTRNPGNRIAAKRKRKAPPQEAVIGAALLRFKRFGENGAGLSTVRDIVEKSPRLAEELRRANPEIYRKALIELGKHR